MNLLGWAFIRPIKLAGAPSAAMHCCHTRSKLLIHISAFLCVFMRYTRFLHETESRRQRALRGNVLFLFYFFRIRDARYNLRKQNQHASKYFCLNYYFYYDY